MGSMPLRRVGGLAKALVVLLAVYVAVTILAAILTQSVLGDVEDFLDGSISEDELTDALGPTLGLGFVQGGVTIALVVLTMIWMYRIAGNHRSIGRRTTWAAGWAIGGWFLPPVLFVIPFLMLMEMWKASEPTSPPGDEGWRRASVSPLVPIWWVLYGVLPLVLIITGRNPLRGIGGDIDDVAEQFDEQRTQSLLQSILSVLAAIAFGLLVRAMTDRHTRLTGEASAR